MKQHIRRLHALIDIHYELDALAENSLAQGRCAEWCRAWLSFSDELVRLAQTAIEQWDKGEEGPANMTEMALGMHQHFKHPGQMTATQ